MRIYWRLLGFFMIVMLSGCGYQLQGTQAPAFNSALGDGNKTVLIEKVEQSSMYTWLPYYVRSVMQDEIYLRKIAQWKNDGNADYLMVIRIPSFQVGSSITDNMGETLLSAATVRLEIIVYDAKDRHIVWRSGMVGYTERYETVSKSRVLKEIVRQALREAVDRMQQNF